MKQHSFLPPLANRFITVPTRCSFESLTLSPIHILYKYVIQPDPNFLGQYRVFRKNIILNTPSQSRFPTDLCCPTDTRLWKKSPSESLPLPKPAHSKTPSKKGVPFPSLSFPLVTVLSRSIQLHFATPVEQTAIILPTRLPPPFIVALLTENTGKLGRALPSVGFLPVACLDEEEGNASPFSSFYSVTFRLPHAEDTRSLNFPPNIITNTTTNPRLCICNRRAFDSSVYYPAPILRDSIPGQ